MLQAFAIRAIHIGEHHQLAAAVALHHLNGLIQGQLGEVYFRQLVHALRGQIFFGFRINQTAFRNQEAHFFIGVDNLPRHKHFIQTRVRRFADAFYFKFWVGGFHGFFKAGFVGHGGNTEAA